MDASIHAQRLIRVDVAFYDAQEQGKLMAFPTSAAIAALVSGPLEITCAEFLTYYLFHRIKLGQPDYRDFRSVGEKIHLWLDAIRECIAFEDESIHTPPGALQQLNEVSEHVGEAIGLAAINRVHGLTEADWRPIPEQRGAGARPSFDFQIASDGLNIIQVETKGSSVEDNRELSAAVKAQKRKIDEKKRRLAELANRGTDPNPAHLRYGTITVIDSRKEGNVRCLLTDPPPEPVTEDPKVLRLLSRIRCLRDWISFLSPRSALAAALATRVADIEVLTNPFELDGVPLQNGTGEGFDTAPFSRFKDRHSAFMASKSKVTDSPAGGAVFQLSNRALIFIGIREDLLRLAKKQEFGEIMGYRFSPASKQENVDCTISAGRFKRLQLPASVIETAKRAEGYLHFQLTGSLNYSSAGLVFGVLPLPEE